ncbi:MAG: ATP-binding protein [Clostridiales bacterium]|jgi:DNA replication protein DnaC|nr:ATP-binding protein [Clostridiales bacterium]
MGRKSCFDEVMREYERDRQNSKWEMDARRAKVYREIPRVSAIDNEMATVGTKISRLILNNPSNQDQLLEELRVKSREQAKEKRSILRSSRFGEKYLDPIYVCPICKDTGYIENEKCRCLKQRLIDKNYANSRLGKILEEENFQNFNWLYYSDKADKPGDPVPREVMRLNMKHAFDFVKGMETGLPPRNLFLYGEPGLGKTFMCNCIAKEALDRGKTVLYESAPRTFRILDDIKFNRAKQNDEEDFFSELSDVDVLIVDDLGTEFTTLNTQSILFDILNTRLQLQRNTVISSNLNPSDFHEIYSERLVSRFYGNFNMLKFIGKDIRLLKKYSKC